MTRIFFDARICVSTVALPNSLFNQYFELAQRETYPHKTISLPPSVAIDVPTIYFMFFNNLRIKLQ